MPCLADVLDKVPKRPLPVWLMRQAGRYLPEYRALRAKAGSFWALCNNAGLAAEVTLQPIARFDLDAAIVFSDILTIPAALGQEVRMEEGVGPSLAPFPGVTRLERDDDVIRTKLRPVRDALEIVRPRLAAGKSLIGFAGAAWTLATYMLGGAGPAEERARRAGEHPELRDLLAVLANRIAAHLSAQLAAGADVVQLFDSWASGLDDVAFRDRVIVPTAHIVAGLRASAPDARIIGFPRGATPMQYMAYARDTGVNGVSIDTAIAPGWAVRELGNVVCQGNLDPRILVAGGRVLDDAVAGIVSAAGARAFIFNLGHGVLPETPPENIARLVKTVRALSAP